MSTAEKKLRYTFAEYLAMEEQADYKSEYYQGEIFAMSGGTGNHSLIGVNVNAELRSALLDKDCSVFGSDFKIRIEASDTGVYPDGTVFCGPIDYVEDRKDIATNPIVVIEVLSNSTAAYDRSGKFSHYRRIPSLKEYVLIEQDRAQVDVFRRNENGLWLGFEGFEGLDKSVEFKSLGISIPSKMIYHRVQFPPQSSKFNLNPS